MLVTYMQNVFSEVGYKLNFTLLIVLFTYQFQFICYYAYINEL